MAMAILFAASTNAEAQFGGLLKKAKKAVQEEVNKKTSEEKTETTVEATTATETATETTSSSSSSTMDVAPKGWRYHNGKVHKYVPVDKEEIKTFLELNTTPEREKVYSYFDMPLSAISNSQAKKTYQSVAEQLVNLEWDLHEVENHLQGMTPEVWMKRLNTEFPENIDRAAAYGEEPAEVADYFDAELVRVKARFHDKYFPNEPKLEGADNSAYLKERMDGRAVYKYALNELKDKGSNPKLKQEFEAAVKAQLKPDRIIAVYLVSNFWRGLPAFQMPEYGQDWVSVQEKPLKAYYIKGGKYYYVKGGFRQGRRGDDGSTSNSPIANYNPGLETPLEIPANLAKKYFK